MARAVRLFVSSTFRDMQAERDALARLCFPQARRAFAAVGRPFVEIDLRWGLRVGESEERIVDLCLKEVSRCHGFFVGILGARYGFVPEALPELATALDAPAGTSITEYEILAGAFAAPPRAFVRFFFRGDGSDDEPAMRRLKADIRARGLPVQTYESPDALALQLREALEGLAREEPHGASTTRVVDDLACLQAEGAWLRAQAVSSLRAWWGSGSPRLNLVAPEGAGKTTLLSQWLMELKQVPLAPPKPSGWKRLLSAVAEPVRPLHVAVHFAGTDLCETGLSRAVADLHAQLQQAAASPPAHGSLAQRLLQWHAAVLAVCERGDSVLLVLDGVDLVVHGSQRDLSWLPPDHPRLRILVSSRRPVPNPEHGAWQLLELQALAPSERGELLQTRLHRFGKSLDAPHLAEVERSRAIVTAAEVGLLAEELRLLGGPEQVSAFFGALSKMPLAVDLGSQILARLEAELGAGLIRDACALLAVSRGGVPEEELRALLLAGHELSGATWSALMQGFRMSIFDRAGRLGLFDPTIRAAAVRRYGLASTPVQAWRESLVRFHWPRLLDESAVAPRVVEELPWQLEHLQDGPRLQQCLQKAAFSAALWRHEPDACIRHWRGLLASQRLDLAEHAKAWVHDTRAHPELASPLSALLLELGRADLALDLLPRGDALATQETRINLAALLLEQGAAKEALMQLGDATVLAGVASPMALVALGLHGNALYALGQAAEALAVHQRCVEGWEQAGQPLSAAHSRHNQALCLMRLARWREACALLEPCGSVFERAHDHAAWASSQIALADVRFAMNRAAEGLKLLERAQEYAQRHGDVARVAQAMAGRGRILEATGQRDAAEAVQLQRQTWCEQHGDATGALKARLDRVVIRMNLGPRGLKVAAALLQDSLAWAATQDMRFGPDVEEQLARLAAGLGLNSVRTVPRRAPMTH